MSNFDDFALMMFVQKRKIETDRYDEGIKIGHDPRKDSDYDLNWALKKAQEFRSKWKKCCCRSCTKAKECGFKLAEKCPYHQPIIKHLKKVVEIEMRR
jgi:hypothetical protein